MFLISMAQLDELTDPLLNTQSAIVEPSSSPFNLGLGQQFIFCFFYVKESMFCADKKKEDEQIQKLNIWMK